MYHSLGEENFKRYARLTARDIEELPELIPAEKKDDCVNKSILKVMRKIAKHVSSMISDHFDDLTLIEQEMFILYWNINPSRDELNLRELGDLLGVSREAARQVKERAIKKLKKKLRPHAFDDFFREAV
jgi:RNA polymerase sigma factor (sigma-70 family)